MLVEAQTDLAVNWPRVSDEPLRNMLAEAVTGALANAEMSAAEHRYGARR